MSKILVEGSPMFRNRTGVGQYTYNLLRHLLTLDKKNQYVIFGFLLAGKKFVPPIPETANVRYKLIRYFPSKAFSLLSRKLLPPPVDLLLAQSFDIAMFTNFVSTPLVKTKRSLVVIYDLSYIFRPEYTNKKNLELLKKQVPKSLARSNHIVTISENSKTEITNYFKVPADKITVVTPAVNHRLFKPQPDKTVERIIAKYGIKKPYILSVCTLEPRKNLKGVLDAFEKLPEDVKSAYMLVLVGGKGWLSGELEAKYDQLAGKHSLIKTGYVPDEDLPALYSGAAVFVYPSFYEGFGMPPLEAMACGTPVITSDNTSLPEVVGDAGVMIKAEDTQKLSSAIHAVLSSDKLAATMKAKGLVQAKKFTWEESAEKLLQIIKRMVLQ